MNARQLVLALLAAATLAACGHKADKAALPEAGAAARALAGLAHAFHHCQVHGGAESAPPVEQARHIVDLALHGIRAVPTPAS